MAEPQPSTVESGDTTQSVPAGGDDKKAAAALSSLDQPSVSDDGAGGKKEIDTKALGAAMERLEVASGKGGASTQANKVEKKEEPAKKVKIEAADVTAVVDLCDVNKIKATEILRQYDGDLGRALRGWVGVGA